MIKRFAFILLLLCQYPAGAQNWGAVPGADFNNGTDFIMNDSVHNELIVSSKFISYMGGNYVRGICRWNGSRWDSMAGGINTHDQLNVNPNGDAIASVEYNGKLLVGGQFRSMGGVNATCLALWDGIKWDSLPKRAFRFSNVPRAVTGFYKYNNLLYIYGTFDSIAGQKCSGIATWDGVNFTPITLPVSDVGSVRNLAFFKNELYVAGGFFTSGMFFNHKRHILKYDGTKWDSVGVGILGSGGTGLAAMTIYKNELYVGGSFQKASGNAGENVMKWDGSQWIDVGFEGEHVGGVRQFIVHKDKLYAIGSFIIAANNFANFFAVYDGKRWCTTKDTLDNAITSGIIFRDTLYIGGGFWTIGGDSVKYIARLLNDEPYRWCNPALPINEEPTNLAFLYPNPFTDLITVHVPENYTLPFTRIRVTNNLGQVLTDVSPNQVKEILNLSFLSSGMYFLTVEDNKSKKTVKIIKQ